MVHEVASITLPSGIVTLIGSRSLPGCWSGVPAKAQTFKSLLIVGIEAIEQLNARGDVLRWWVQLRKYSDGIRAEADLQLRPRTFLLLLFFLWCFFGSFFRSGDGLCLKVRGGKLLDIDTAASCGSDIFGSYRSERNS